MQTDFSFNPKHLVEIWRPRPVAYTFVIVPEVFAETFNGKSRGGIGLERKLISVIV